jgi:hypothetical protein
LGKKKDVYMRLKYHQTAGKKKSILTVERSDNHHLNPTKARPYVKSKLKQKRLEVWLQWEASSLASTGSRFQILVLPKIISK